MLATFGRDKERELWFPVLSRHGFTRLDLSADVIDKENAIDAVGYDAEGARKLFALRSRDMSRYTASQLARFKREFTTIPRLYSVGKVMEHVPAKRKAEKSF